MAESRMTWKVRGIIKIYDSYIRRPASTANLQIRTDQGLSVIRKSEGILVFVENHNFTDRGPVQVVLESPLFLRETVVLPLDSDPEVQVVWPVSYTHLSKGGTGCQSGHFQGQLCDRSQAP